MAANLKAMLEIATRVTGQGDLTTLNANLTKLEGTAKKAQASFKGVVSSAAWQTAAIGAAAIGAALVSSVRTAMDFDQALSGVQAKLGLAKNEMGALRQTAEDLGRTTKFSATEVAEGMDFLAMAGFETNEIIAAMPALLDLAAAGALDLATTSDIASDAMGGFGLAAEDTRMVADALAAAVTSGNTNIQMIGDTMKYVGPPAKAFGATLQETAAMASLLGDAGIKASQAGTSMRAIFLRLAAPPKKAAVAMEELGISTTDASGNLKGIQEILGDVNQAFKDGNISQADRIRLSRDLAGAEAVTALQVLLAAEAAGTLAERIDHVNDSQGAAARMAETMGDNVAGAFKRLQSAWEGFQIQLVGGQGGGLQTLVDGLANVLNLLTSMMKQFPLATSVLVVVTAAVSAFILIAPFLASAMTVLSAVGGLFAAGGALAGVGATIAGIAGAVVPALIVVKAALAGFLAWGTGTLVPALLAIFSGPVGWTILAVAAVVAMCIFFREPLMDFVRWLWEWGAPIREFWIGLWEGARDAAVSVWGAVVDTVQNAGERIQSAWEGVIAFFDGIWQGILTAAQAAWDGMVQALQGVGESILGFWQGVVRSIGEVLGSLLGRVQQAWEPIGAWLSSIAGWYFDTLYKMLIEPFVVWGGMALNALQSGWERVQGFMVQQWGRLTQLASDAAQSVGQAFQAGWGAIVSWFGANVVEPIRRAWGELTQWLGANIVQPVQRGLAQLGGLFRQYMVLPMQQAFQQAGALFQQYVVTPIQQAWDGLTAWLAGSLIPAFQQAWNGTVELFRQYVMDPISNAWQQLQDVVRDSFNAAAEGVARAFSSIGEGLSSAFQRLVRSVGNMINGVIDVINGLIRGMNTVRSAAGLSAINQMPRVSFAWGGVVDRPTNALIGEAGEREYVIPESRMATAAARYLSGARGGGVLAGGAPAGAGGGVARPVVNITTGPVMRQGGQDWVTVQDLETVARDVATQIYSTLRTPGGRRAMGIS